MKRALMIIALGTLGWAGFPVPLRAVVVPSTSLNAPKENGYGCDLPDCDCRSRRRHSWPDLVMRELSVTVHVIGGTLAALILVYLLVALVKPEKF